MRVTVPSGGSVRAGTPSRSRRPRSQPSDAARVTVPSGVSVRVGIPSRSRRPRSQPSDAVRVTVPPGGVRAGTPSGSRRPRSQPSGTARVTVPPEVSVKSGRSYPGPRVFTLVSTSRSTWGVRNNLDVALEPPGPATTTVPSTVLISDREPSRRVISFVCLEHRGLYRRSLGHVSFLRLLCSLTAPLPRGLGAPGVHLWDPDSSSWLP